MSRELAIRITADNDEALKQFATQYQSIWCKEEPDLEKHCNRTHYHGYLLTDLTNNGLRKQIYNYFDIPKEKRGNTSLAFSAINDDRGGKDGMLRYICKGTAKTYPNIVYDSFPLDTNELYQAYWSANQDLKEKLEAQRNLKKTTKANFKDYIISYVESLKNNYGKAKMTREQLCITMVEWYKKNGYELPSRSQGQIIVNDVYIRYSCSEEQYKDVIYRYYGFGEYQN